MSGLRTVATTLWETDRVPLEQLCENNKIDQKHLVPFKEALRSHEYSRHFMAKEGPNGVPVGAFVRFLLGKDQIGIGAEAQGTDVASVKAKEDVSAHFSDYPDLDLIIQDRVTRLRLVRLVNQVIERVLAGGEVLHSACPTPSSMSMDPTPVSGITKATSSAPDFPATPSSSQMPMMNSTPVGVWLAAQGMQPYVEAMHKEGFDEMEDLKAVAFAPEGSAEQTAFQSIVHLLGHQKKIKRLLQDGTTQLSSSTPKEWMDKIGTPADDPTSGSPARSEADSFNRHSPPPSAFVDSAIITMSTGQRGGEGGEGSPSAFHALAAIASSSGTPTSGVNLSQFVNRAPSHTVRVNGRLYDKRLLVPTRGLRNTQQEGLKFCVDEKCLRRHLQFATPTNRKDSLFELCAVSVDAPPIVLDCDNIHAGFVRTKFKGRYAVWSMRWVSELTEGLSKQLEDKRGRNRLIVCEEATCTFRERCSSGHFEIPVDGTSRNILDFGSTTALQLLMQQQWVDKLTLVKPSELKRGADDRSSLATEEYLALLDGDDDDHRISLHQHANRRNTNLSGLPVMRPASGDCLAGLCDSFHFFGLCGRGAGCPFIHIASPAKSKLVRGVFLRLHYDPLLEHFQCGEHQEVAAGSKLRPKSHQQNLALIDDVASLKDRLLIRRRKFMSVSEVGDVLLGTTCQVCRHAMYQLLKEVFNRSSCSLLGALCGRYGALRVRKNGKGLENTDADLEDMMWNVQRYLQGNNEPVFEDELATHEALLLINRAVSEAILNHPAFPPRVLAPGQQLHMQPEIPVYWDFENVLITDKEELQMFITCVRSLLCCEGIAFSESRVRIKAFGTQSVFNNVIDYVRDMQVEMVLCSDRKSEEVDRSIEKSIRETVLDTYKGSAYPAFVMITSDKDSIGIAEEGRAQGKKVFFIHDAPKGGNHERTLAKASTNCYSLMDVYLSPFTKPEDRMIVGSGQAAVAAAPRNVMQQQQPHLHQTTQDPPYNQLAQRQQQQQSAAASSQQQVNSERSVMSFFNSGNGNNQQQQHQATKSNTDNMATNMLREASGARAGAGSRAMTFGAAQQQASPKPKPTSYTAAATPGLTEPKVSDLLASAMKLQQQKGSASSSSIPVPKSAAAVKGVQAKNPPPQVPAGKKQQQQQSLAKPAPLSHHQQQQQQQQHHADPTAAVSTAVDPSDIMGVLDPHFMPKRSSVAYYLLLADSLVLRILDLHKRSEEGPKKDPSMVRGPFKYTLPGRARGQFDSKGAKIGGSTNLDSANNGGKYDRKHAGGGGKKREDTVDRLNGETFELEDEVETKEQKAATAAYRSLETDYHQSVQDEMRLELSRFLTKAKAVMPPWFTASPDKLVEKRCLADLTKAPDMWLDMKEVVRRYPHANAAALLRKKKGLPPMVEMDTYRNALAVLRCVGNAVEGPIEGALQQASADLQRVVLLAAE